MTVPLPPLPRIGDRWNTPPPGPDLLDVLARGHHQLRVLCLDLADLAGPPGRRSRVADVLTAVLSRHLSAEEQYLHPTVRAVLPGGDSLADRELAADGELRRLMRELGRAAPGADRYERLVHAVCAEVDRHVEEATRWIAPRLRRACTEEELVRLGNRLEIALEAAPTRPHATPARPPWNKLVDPALGVADKLRDLVAGRPTYPSDLD